jgi:hypothetical protein
MRELRRTPEGDTLTADLPPYPGTPRWVKVVGIIAVVLVLLFVILHLTGNRFRFHTSSGNHGGHTPPIEQRVQQP